MPASARESIPADAASFPIPKHECRAPPGIQRAVGITPVSSERKSRNGRLSILPRPHAEDEVSLRLEEALQGDGRRQGPRSSRVLESHPREEVAQAQALVPQAARARGVRRQARRQAAWRLRAMTRVKRSVNARKKRRAVLERAKGFRGEAHSSYKRAKEAVMKADSYAYRDRRNRKRDFRRLWITRINAAARAEGMTYATFIHGLQLAGVELDSKVLADIAVRDPETFRRFAERAREAAAA